MQSEWIALIGRSGSTDLQRCHVPLPAGNGNISLGSLFADVISIQSNWRNRKNRHESPSNVKIKLMHFGCYLTVNGGGGGGFLFYANEAGNKMGRGLGKAPTN